MSPLIKRFFIGVLSVIVLFCFSSCSDNNQNSDTTDTVSTTTADEQTEAVTTVIPDTSAADTTFADTTAEDTTEALYNWNNQAVSVLADYADTDAVYSLYDMNGDKIPEIIVFSGNNSSDMKYCLYDLKSGGDPFPFGSGNSILGGYNGDLIMQYCKMGFETITKYSYDGSKLSDEIILDREVPVGEDYLSITELKTYSVNDMSGFSWNENMHESNASVIDNVK